MADDLVRSVERDFEFAREGRLERETAWAAYWSTYLSMERQYRRKHRSNGVGPHGGMAIRLIVPLLKRAILSTRPFIHAVSRKRELDDFMDLIDRRMDYWVDFAEVRQIVLTHGLKDALIFGGCWHKCARGTRGRQNATGLIPGRGEDGEFKLLPAEGIDQRVTGPRVFYIPVEDSYPYPLARTYDELAETGYFIHRFFRSKKELLEDPNYDRDAVEKIGTKVGGSYSGGIPLETIFAEQRRRVLGLSRAQWANKLAIMRENDDEPIECLERVENGRLVTIGNRSVNIRGGKDGEELDHQFPIFSLTPDPIPGEIFGKSIYHDSLSPMKQRDFVANNIYDNLARLVHSQFKGMANMYDAKALAAAKPGGVVTVRRMDALEPLVQQDTIQSAFPMLAHLDRDIERGHGLSEVLSTIGAGAGTSYPETATVGSIKNENALLFVGEMVSQLEDNGLKRMAQIFFDLEAEHTTAEDWVRLAGEEGARWRDVDFDTIAAQVDFTLVGSSYAESKRNQAQNLSAVVQNAVLIHDRDPSAIKLRELARVLFDVMDIPNADRIVPGRPVDVGPDAEHDVMRTGLPVKPDLEEDLQVHLVSHMQELARAMAEEGADQGYIERLMEHARETQKMIQEAVAAAASLQQENSPSGGSNGEAATAPPGAAGV